MDCAEVASLVVAYHFGTVDDAERDAIEEHLVGCTSCLQTYLALKRATEKGRAARPSRAARARLRAAVDREVRHRLRPASLLARRIPLYQGIVAAAIAAVIALAMPRLLGGLERRDIGRGSPQVDTARAHAESLQIY